MRHRLGFVFGVVGVAACSVFGTDDAPAAERRQWSADHRRLRLLVARSRRWIGGHRPSLPHLEGRDRPVSSARRARRRVRGALHRVARDRLRRVSDRQLRLHHPELVAGDQARRPRVPDQPGAHRDERERHDAPRRLRGPCARLRRERPPRGRRELDRAAGARLGVLRGRQRAPPRRDRSAGQRGHRGRGERRALHEDRRHRRRCPGRRPVRLRSELQRGHEGRRSWRGQEHVQGRRLGWPGRRGRRRQVLRELRRARRRHAAAAWPSARGRREHRGRRSRLLREPQRRRTHEDRLRHEWRRGRRWPRRRQRQVDPDGRRRCAGTREGRE